MHTYVDGSWSPPDEDVTCPFAGYGVAELIELGDCARGARASTERVTARCATDGRSNAALGPMPGQPPPARAADDLRVPLGQLTTHGPDGDGVARLAWIKVGTVQDERDAADYIGACGHTNNTGELSALYYALERALQRRGTREVVHSDSLYAINMTRGVWLPRRKGKRNAPMIGRLRSLWCRLRWERPGEVELRHVRSHVRVPGNELADYLAEAGRSPGSDVTLESATDWLRQWLRRHHAPGPPGRGLGAGMGIG